MLAKLIEKISSKKQTGKKETGDEAERIAEKLLVRSGLCCLERNYRCRFGEIDLIMQEKPHINATQNQTEKTLVFVEVRLRKSGGFGGAAASIGVHKQKRIIAAAQHYLSGMREFPPCRFDAVLLNDLSGDRIEWIKDAFSA